MAIGELNELIITLHKLGDDIWYLNAVSSTIKISLRALIIYHEVQNMVVTSMGR